MEEQTPPNIYDCIVIGGGISGVSFAHYLQRQGRSTLILEKENRLGGRIRSIKPADKPGFWSELGAHTCYNSYTELINLVRESGESDNLIALGPLSYVLHDKKKIKGVFSELTVLPMAFRFWKYFTTSKVGKTAREYFQPIVGESNYKHVFSKLFRAVISQEADEYPAEIFLKKRDTKDETVSRRFSYRGGLSQLVEDIATESGAEVLLSSQVDKVEKGSNGLFCIQIHSGKTFFARNVALAAEVSEVPALLSRLQMDDAVEHFRTISSSRSIAVNLLIEKNKLPLKKVAGIIPLSDEFFSAVSRDSIEDDDYRTFTFHFPESRVSPAERLETIFRVLGIEDEHSSRTAIYRHSLPALGIQHLNLSEKISGCVANSGVYVLGNYFHGMSIEDCVRRSKEEAERFAQSH